MPDIRLEALGSRSVVELLKLLDKIVNKNCVVICEKKILLSLLSHALVAPIL